MIFDIEQIHYDENYKGNEVISRLKYSCRGFTNLIECQKRDMINFINQGSTAYTYVNGKIGDSVHVVNNSFLRTDGNNILSDNLGNLPQF